MRICVLSSTYSSFLPSLSCYRNFPPSIYSTHNTLKYGRQHPSSFSVPKNGLHRRVMLVWSIHFLLIIQAFGGLNPSQAR